MIVRILIHVSKVWINFVILQAALNKYLIDLGRDPVLCKISTVHLPSVLLGLLIVLGRTANHQWKQMKQQCWMTQAAATTQKIWLNMFVCISRMLPPGDEGNSYFLLKFDTALLEPSKFAIYIAIFLHPVSRDSFHSQSTQIITHIFILSRQPVLLKLSTCEIGILPHSKMLYFFQQLYLFQDLFLSISIYTALVFFKTFD